MTATAIDPAIAAHEARHAAAAMMLGLEATEARADNPSPDAAGHVMLAPYSELRPRESAVMTLAGRWGDPGWPPESPSKSGRTIDEQQLADDVETLGLGRHGYELLVADTKHLVATPEFKSLVDTLELLLARGCVLREDQLDQIHQVCGETQLQHKAVKATARVATDLGEFSAIAAAYSVDRQREQIVRGAFGKTIERGQASGKRIPLHWNHSPAPKDIIGSVEPASIRETSEGLFVRGKVDLDGSEIAREAWRSMKANAVSLSFGFLATDTFKRSDGIRELRELDLFEVSITPVAGQRRHAHPVDQIDRRTHQRARARAAQPDRCPGPRRDARPARRTPRTSRRHRPRREAPDRRPAPPGRPDPARSGARLRPRADQEAGRMSDDEIRIPWGMPGPTDPVDRAWAHHIDMDRTPLRLERVRWSQEGVPDVEQRSDADDQ